MIVVDASLVVDFLLGSGSPGGEKVAEKLRIREELCAPHLVDAEVGQVLRRFALGGALTKPRAETLVGDFIDLPITRYPHQMLLERAFELRSNATVYDGFYLALAEGLEISLMTGDKALANVPGCRARVEIYATSA